MSYQTNGVASPELLAAGLALTESVRLTHKQKCINYAQEFLMNVGLQDYWCQADFMAYYRKHNGANANAYFLGMDAADYIIRQASHKATQQELEE